MSRKMPVVRPVIGRKKLASPASELSGICSADAGSVVDIRTEPVGNEEAGTAHRLNRQQCPTHNHYPSDISEKPSGMSTWLHTPEEECNREYGIGFRRAGIRRQ
jgi:hypothetical protein